MTYTEPKFCPKCGKTTMHTVSVYQEIKRISFNNEILLNVRSINCTKCDSHSTIKEAVE